ncbi:MAG: 6-phosphofructokinase [Anaerolineales bacterium]|nr:6-phosphofructokinase [Anaerolineales bacterium]
MSGIAGGAEAVVIPEAEVNLEKLAEDVRTAYERGKAHAIIVVAEGVSSHEKDTHGGSNNSLARGAEGIARHFREHHERLGFDLRVTTLGRVQRGGAPGAFDRLLATRLGAAATEHFARGEQGVLMGLLGGEIVATPLAEVIKHQKEPDLQGLELAHALSL